MVDNKKYSTTKVPKNLAEAMINMKALLLKNYGYDFAFVIMGKGNVLSASNSKMGNIHPTIQRDET